MKKGKSAITLLVICLLLILAACGGNNTSSTNASDNNESVSNSEKKASDYPKRPVTLMIPFGAGGTTDLFTRQFADIAEKHLGQRIIIKNETGGGGLTLYSTIAKANPDGYSMCLCLGTSLYATNQYTKLMDYTPEDFSLISTILQYEYIIAASSKAPFQTFEEMIEYSKNNKVAVASPALVNSLFIESINQAEDFQLNWDIVNYKSSGEASAAILGGHVDMVLDPPLSYLGPAESGDMNILAQLNQERSDLLSDVPTLKEMGYELNLASTIGLGGPAGLPDDVKAKWEEAIAKTLEDPALKEFAKKNGFRLTNMNEEETVEFFGELGKQLGSVVERVIE
ncbi:tripartite tricarboxylate transporter substrate binding protein [Bacillus dakarensis]|uniref:tripartite tricarboxylate transporter substrate binding protein n=1 Tax=Robertmurraya dakarensis TaxID=1926278 RepID=UPI0009809FEE|nr:tripartite tricarboxylate transporter substrate binding protein [Bacillus dakarensis]